MLEQLLQIRAGLGVLVVAHPAFIEVNVFAAACAAVGDHLVGIQPRRALVFDPCASHWRMPTEAAEAPRGTGSCFPTTRKASPIVTSSQNGDARMHAALIFHGVPCCRRSLIRADLSALAECQRLAIVHKSKTVKIFSVRRRSFERLLKKADLKFAIPSPVRWTPRRLASRRMPAGPNCSDRPQPAISPMEVFVVRF